MKKTYNVTSTKFSSVFTLMMFFAFFFLGMNSTDAQVLSTSRVEADKIADVDYSLTAKAEITVSEEDAISILMQEATELKKTNPATAVDEAEGQARTAFLRKTVDELEAGVSVNQALTKGQAALAIEIGKFNDATKQLIDADGIVREYVARLQ